MVMAGVGFDAAVMAGAPHELKCRLGPLAYFVSGVRALRGPRAPIALAVDGRIAPPHQVRTVVVGSGGKLLAGMVLMPAAKVDDGLLDVVSIGPRTSSMVGGDRAGADPSLPWPPDRAALAGPHRHHQRGVSTAGPTRWRFGG